MLKRTQGSFAHSEHLYVLDGERRLRGVLNGTRVDVKRSARELVAKLRSAARPLAGR